MTVILTPAIGPVGAAAVGNVASQAFGVATGIQEKFSFKSLAITVLTAGVAQGLDKVGAFAKLGIDGSGFFNAAARGALTNATTQGLATVIGLQDKFSWAGVAAAGIGAGVGEFAGNKLFGAQNGQYTDNISGYAQRAVAATAGAIASAATRSAISGGSFGDNFKAAIPDIVSQFAVSAGGKGIAALERAKTASPAKDVAANPASTVKSTVGATASRVVETQSEQMPKDIVVTGTRLLSPSTYITPIRYDKPTRLEQPIAGGMVFYRDPRYDPYSRTFREDGEFDNRNSLEKMADALGIDRSPPQTPRERYNRQIREAARATITSAIADSDTSSLARQALRLFLSDAENRTLVYNADLTQELFDTGGGNYYLGYEESAVRILLNKGGQSYLVDGVSANRIVTRDWNPADAVWAGRDGYDLPDVVGTFTYGVTARVADGQIHYTALNVMGLESFAGGNLLGRSQRLDIPTTGSMANVRMEFSWSRPIPANLRPPPPSPPRRR